MDNWYVVTAWTGKEYSCVESIRAYNMEKSIDNVLPFVPTKETFFQKQGSVKTKTTILFPGYVFAETPMNAADFMKYIRNLRRALRNSITVLTYGDSDESAVRWEEQLFLMKLMNHEWCVKTSLGFKENGRARVISGPLFGHEGQIKKVDRHKMKAMVEIEMQGRVHHLNLGLQVLSVGNE